MNHVFCRELAIERGEPMEGTGQLRPRLLLLAWPRGQWRSPKWRSAGMSPALAGAVEAAGRGENQVILVESLDKSPLPRLMAFPEARAFTPDDEPALIAAITAWRQGEPLPGTPEPRTTIVCCTDSRADACCARFGFATAKALAAAADPERFLILQGSHIGGCRFAASLAVVSRRERYARLAPEAVPDFLESLGRGEIYLPAFKGRADRAEPEQVAELAALRWAAKAGRGQGPVVLAIEAAQADWRRYRAELGGDRLTVEVRARVLPMHGKCAAIHTEEPRPTTRWIVASVEARA